MADSQTRWTLIKSIAIFVLILGVLVPVGEFIAGYYSNQNGLQATGILANVVLTAALVAGYLRMVSITEDQQTLMEAEHTVVLGEERAVGSDYSDTNGTQHPYPQYVIELQNSGLGLAKDIQVEFRIDHDGATQEQPILPYKTALSRTSGNSQASTGEGGVLNGGNTEEFSASVEFQLGPEQQSDEDNPISFTWCCEDRE